MSKVSYARLILSIGSLQFFECKSNTFLFGKPTYYWKFRDDTAYYGPFDSLMSAGHVVDLHVTGKTTPASLKTNSSTIQANPDNVIIVDFKSKKRVK
jgi:hypothetical protein